ncbi:MAG: ATP-binding protein [Clostridia bacterium]|nr:ATP-binding protein [Clostridia bacterium]
MEEFIICLVKYTAIFVCILYSYIRLLRLKLKVWDLFDIPLFIVFSTVLYFVTVYIKMLVPLGLLIFSVAFLLLRFRKSFYVTVTVGTIALGVSIVLMLIAFVLGYILSIPLYFVKNEAAQKIIAQVINAVIQVAGIFLLFLSKRLQSGINPENTNPTFEIMLHLSVGSIIAMMLLYIRNATQSMLEIILIIVALFALLIILWWRKHIKYNYNKAVEQQSVDLMENTIKDYEMNSAESDLQLAAYAKYIHYLNKALPDCAILAKRAAEATGNADAIAVFNMLEAIMSKTNIVNEKCSFENIPRTGDSVIDAPIIRLYAEAERKNFTASAEISDGVKNWFADGTLDKDDIHTLLGYLCDNAVNSALGSPNAKVRAELAETENLKPLIRIYDSGAQFNEDVLAKLGREQITTRAGVNGHGIGLLSVFETLAKYGASFTLDEAPQIFGFTKFIEIAFDGRHSVTVKTCRESVASACADRKDMTVELIDSAEDLRDII